LEDIREGLKNVFGIAYFAFANKTELSIEDLKVGILKEIERRGVSQYAPTFGVITRRSNKNFSHTSQEVNEIIGREVQNLTKAKVDLDQPQFPIHIEILLVIILISLPMTDTDRKFDFNIQK